MSVVITTRQAEDQLSAVLGRSRAVANGNAVAIERWLSLIAGGLLTAYAVRRRSPGGVVAGIAGAGLLYRGITATAVQAQRAPHVKGTGRASDTRARLGGAGGILVDESVTIGRPIGDVYRFWRQLENLPRFLTHLRSVSVRADGTSHWVANGPANRAVEWDARVINEVENKILGWQSLDGSEVATAGSVNFRPTTGGTIVHVRFQYDPPGGKLGAAVSGLLGHDPAESVRSDLARLKSLMEEAGPAGGTLVSGFGRNP